MFVAQTLAQLKDTYKDNWETLVANAGIKLFFGNDDNTTRKYVADLIGETEVRRWTRTISHTDGSTHTESVGQQIGTSRNTTSGHSSNFTYGEHMSASFGYSSSESYGSTRSRSQGYSDATNESDTEGVNETIHKRYLITPDEVGRLFGNREIPTMLVLTAGAQPSAVQRKMYHTDAVFQGLFDPHPDHSAPTTLAARETEKQEGQKIETLPTKQSHPRLLGPYGCAKKRTRGQRLAQAIIHIGFIFLLIWVICQYAASKV
ncbi:TraM recognition domain-containing protein [Devosia sp. MC532]|nr:TraM recognition domain-containing protein [Devosia sp. MC532]